MSVAQSKLVKHYKEVRARLEGKPAVVAPVVTLPAPDPVPEAVEKRKSDFENRSEAIKEWVQREMARWDNVPKISTTININKLIQEVAEKYKVPPTLMLQDSRCRPLVFARHELFYRCVMEKGWSYARIGRYFDRDHTTVLHGVRTHAKKYGLPLPEGVKS